MFSAHTYETLGIKENVKNDNTIHVLEENSEDEYEWGNVAISIPSDFENDSIPLTSTENAEPSNKIYEKPKKKTKINTLAKQIVSINDYEEMFSNAWTEACVIFKDKEDLPISPRSSAIMHYIISLGKSSGVFKQVKQDWKCLFTKTPEDKQYQLFKLMTNSEAIDSLSAICDSAKTDDNLTRGEKCAGLHFFLTDLFYVAQIYMHSNKLAKVPIADVQEDMRILCYVAGFVINKLIKSKSKDYRSIGRILQEKDLSKLPLELTEWTDAQNRINLKYPTLEAMEIFKIIQKHIGKYFNATYITKPKQKVIADISEDFILKTKFNIVAEKAGVDIENSKSAFSLIINTSINTAGNGHTKNLRNELKTKIRSKRLTTKTNSKEKSKTKIENEVKEQISKKYNLIL